MHHLLLALHILFAIFAIGPLAHAATTASRGVKAGDAAAVQAAVRTTRIYGYVSLLVAVLGFAMLGQKGTDEKASFSDTWVWLSVVLYLIALGVVLAILAPNLDSAAKAIGSGESAQSLVGRVAASGGAVGLLFAVIVFLMVYKPGS
jgi:uncharacterized membrane protein